MTAMQLAGGQQHAASAGSRVVVGVDDSPGGLAALRWAVELARSANAPLVAVRVWALGLPRHGGLRRHGGRAAGRVVLAFQGTERRQAAVQLTRRASRDNGNPPGQMSRAIGADRAVHCPFQVMSR